MATPASLTQVSMRPNFAIAASATFCTCCRSATSHSTAMAWPVKPAPVAATAKTMGTSTSDSVFSPRIGAKCAATRIAAALIEDLAEVERTEVPLPAAVARAIAAGADEIESVEAAVGGDAGGPFGEVAGEAFAIAVIEEDGERAGDAQLRIDDVDRGGAAKDFSGLIKMIDDSWEAPVEGNIKG